MNRERLRGAAKAAVWHLTGSVTLAALVALMVFALWYPGAFREMAGGRELFFLIIGVDVVCGPLLTLVVFNAKKPRAELVRDLGLVVLIQMAALGYGVWTVFQARPIFVVHELDRFKVIARVDVDPAAVRKLPDALQPRFFGGPVFAGLRTPSNDERETVMFESVQGGRDYGERPEFYRVYDADAKAVAAKSGMSATKFLGNYPQHRAAIAEIAQKHGLTVDAVRIVPLMARGDWTVVLSPTGDVLDFLKGDAFF